MEWKDILYKVRLIKENNNNNNNQRSNNRNNLQWPQNAYGNGNQSNNNNRGRNRNHVHFANGSENSDQPLRSYQWITKCITLISAYASLCELMQILLTLQ